MGAAASTAKEEIGSSVTASDLTPALACKLTEAEVQAFVAATHFSADEVVALHAHYDLISSSSREDGLIDRSEFQTALGFTVKESLYVDRIFQLFDTNGDSFISFSEFLASLSVLSSKGKPDEKLKFSFDVLDLDRDGKLSKQELLSMLEACIHENSINIPTECLATIVDKTIADVDMDHDGFISFDEYRLLGSANPHMLNHITFNVSSIIADYMPALRSMLAARIHPIIVDRTIVWWSVRRHVVLASSHPQNEASFNWRLTTLGIASQSVVPTVSNPVERRPQPAATFFFALSLDWPHGTPRTHQDVASCWTALPKSLARLSLRYVTVRSTSYAGREDGNESPFIPHTMSANQRGPEHGDAALTTLFAIDPAAIKIGKEIGKGAFSVVYLGEYHKRRVAVKCQPKDDDGHIPPFVLKEVEILQKLRHPNILEFVGAADARKTRQVLILSEHSNHGDLDLLLTNTRAGKTTHMGWLRLADMALDIARGVAFLHASGMIHRDIKSSNILLDDAWRAKLCDFGFATETKSWSDQRRDGSSSPPSDQPEGPRRKSYCGTDAYMAPEMFLDEDYNENVDVFSFGVVLMEMLCCRHANKDGFLLRLPQYKFQIRRDEFYDALPLSCPPPLARLAETCVSFEPSERPTIAEVVAALEQIVASEELTETARGPVELRMFTPTLQQQEVSESEPQIEEDDDSDDEEDDDEEEDDEEDEEHDERDNDSSADTMEIDEEDEEAGPVLPPPYHTGAMLKRNRRGNRGWSEKVFILDRDHLNSTERLALQETPMQTPTQTQTHKATTARRPSQPAPPQTMASLYLKDCRIWKTMEMPELAFNIIDGTWKIKRELRALNVEDLERWMALINHAIDFANEQAAIKASGGVRPSTLHLLFRHKPTTNNGGSRHSSSDGSRERRHSRGSRNRSKTTEERRPEAASAGSGKRTDDVEDTFADHSDEVYQWLKQLELQRYTASFKAKGFATVDYIRETGIEKDDLNFLGIKDPAVRKTLIQAARTLRGDDD